MNTYELPSINDDYDDGLEYDPFLPLPDDGGHFLDIPPADQGGLQGFETPEPDDTGWVWRDARLIGVDRGQDASEKRYEIGAIDLYTHPDSGDLGGSYLPIAAFSHDAPASAFYHDLQRQIQEQRLASYQVPDFAEARAFAMRGEPQIWRGAQPEEYAAYERRHDLDVFDLAGADDPPQEVLDPLIQAAVELGGAAVEQEVAAAREVGAGAFQALNAIGIQAENFDPNAEPPPFYDAETGISYWIGVFQPDKDDREHCVTSILSLGRRPETGAMEAQLAPCVPGDWDKAYAAAEHLIQLAQRGGIDQVFDAAEGMALATGQRELWETRRGVPLEPDGARDLAGDTHETWEVER